MNQNFQMMEEIELWFSEYFRAFVDISAMVKAPTAILSYWGVPLHSSDPEKSRWLTSPDDVVDVLKEMQRQLKKKGYTNTVILDKKVTIYCATASRVETVMSRRRADGVEMDRAAVSFEIRRTDRGWAIISTAAQPTDAEKLEAIW